MQREHASELAAMIEVLISAAPPACDLPCCLPLGSLSLYSMSPLAVHALPQEHAGELRRAQVGF